VSAAEQSVHLTGGILRHFRVFSTHEQSQHPIRQQVTHAVCWPVQPKDELMCDRFSRQIAEAYSLHSEEYGSVLEPILGPSSDVLISLAQLTGTENVLDLATGTGLIARTLLGKCKFVVGLDISSGILREARALSGAELSLAIGDAQFLPIGGESFDLVTCGFSLTHFPDIDRALEEVQRVLRRAGRFITSAWGSQGDSPSKAAAVVVRKRFLDDRDEISRGSFSEEIWANAERGVEMLEQAGFEDVQVTSHRLSGRHKDAKAATKAALAWPITRYRIARLNPSDQRRLKEETAAAIVRLDDYRWESEVHYYQARRSRKLRRAS
jgi:ubiquinone/menaquinone biosynthesis C-methylase UbiE